MARGEERAPWPHDPSADPGTETEGGGAMPRPPAIMSAEMPARPSADESGGRHPQDFPVADRNAIARRAAGGTGASLPLMARQRISLSSKSSIRSYSSKSIFIDRSAP